MSKTVKEVLSSLKGEGNIAKTLAGKASMSKTGFSNLVNGLANDTTYKTTAFGKDGKEVSVNISELIRSDFKKTAANAKYPQKSEIGVYDTCEISTAGIAEAIPYIVTEQIKTGRKFTLPPQKDFGGDIYLTEVKGRTKTSQVRDIKTQADLGTSIITTKDSFQVRAKSPVPKHLQTKVRKDPTGKVITK